MLKFLDLFAGIGGFRLGMEMAGHECIGYVEFDKFARKSYEAMYDTKGEWTAHDITTVTNDDIRKLRDRGRVDVITGGFPCQAFSIAGKRKGFEDTRGTLFFEIARFANILQPRYLFLENVKGLLNHDNGNTFETILRTLDEIGYDAEWDLLNSKDFGVPQNRERVFIIGHLRGASTRKVFPITRNDGQVNELQRQSITTNTLTARYNGVGNGSYVIEGKQHEQVKQVGNIVNTGNWDNPQRGRVYSPEGLSPSLKTVGGGGLEPKIIDDTNTGFNGVRVSSISPTLRSEQYGLKVVQPVLTPDRIKKRQNGRRFKDDGEPMFTITAQDRHGIAIKEATKKGYAVANFGDSVNITYPDSKTRRGRGGKGVANTLQATGDSNQGVVTDQYRIRKLTPKECWRLQGFPDELFDKAAEVNSDSQLYKQAGNSVTVNVIYEIAKKLKE